MQALRDGRVHDGPNAGLPELRAAISPHLERRQKLSYRPADEVLVTVGANEAVFLAIMAFCGPGDEVVIPVPSWPAYEACVRLAGATPVMLALSEGDGYKVDPTALAAAMSERTRMVTLCTPHNPTGAVLDRGRIEQIAAVLRGSNALLLSDEIYSELVYDGSEFVSPAAVADLYARTLVVGGFAKAWSVDGWRLGWLAGPAELVRPALRVRQFTTTCPPTFTQMGGVAALEDADAEREAMRVEFETRRGTWLFGSWRTSTSPSCPAPRSTSTEATTRSGCPTPAAWTIFERDSPVSSTPSANTEDREASRRFIQAPRQVAVAPDSGTTPEMTRHARSSPLSPAPRHARRSRTAARRGCAAGRRRSSSGSAATG